MLVPKFRNYLRKRIWVKALRDTKVYLCENRNGRTSGHENVSTSKIIPATPLISQLSHPIAVPIQRAKAAGVSGLWSEGLSQPLAYSQLNHREETKKGA